MHKLPFALIKNDLLLLYRKKYTTEHTAVVHSTGWPVGYVSAPKCEHHIDNVAKHEMRIAIMDLDVRNRAAKGCDEQDDYIQIRGNFQI